MSLSFFFEILLTWASERHKMLRKSIQDLHIDAYEALGIPMVSVIFLPPEDPEIEDGQAIL